MFRALRPLPVRILRIGTDPPYVQEFGVASDGIREQPRIVSGGMVGDSYMPGLPYPSSTCTT